MAPAFRPPRCAGAPFQSYCNRLVMLVDTMGRAVTDVPRGDAGAALMNDSTPLLEVRDLAKRFGSVVALRSATLTVAPRRDSRVDGRERRGQEHAGENSHWRLSGGCRNLSPRRRRADVSLARRSASSGHRLGLPGSGARSRSDGQPKYAIGRRPLRKRAQASQRPRNRGSQIRRARARTFHIQFCGSSIWRARSRPIRSCLCWTRSPPLFRRTCRNGSSRLCGAGASAAIR